MTDIPQFKTIEACRADLGFLPISLRERPDNRERYVLLNRTSDNFCLDFVGGVNPTSASPAAWFCDPESMDCSHETKGRP
jgi:hypothetical protein